MNFRAARLIFLPVFSLLAVPFAQADRVTDLVRIHREAIGGDERIAALVAMRATGEVVAGGKKMRFTMVAARPDRIRLETENGGRTLVQASDGKNPPWEFDTGQWPPHYRNMPPAVAKTFAADAEFDDPLVGGAERGYAIDYAGEVSTDGKKLIRLLVTHKLTTTFALLIDPETYLILRRIEERTDSLGRTAHIVVQYGNYRPVDGVLIPHDVAVAVDGAITEQTKITAVEANPEIADDAFTRPKAK
jgi:hypothetical protein